MNTVSTLALQAAFAEAIRGITPTAEPLRAIKWSYTPSPRKNGRALLPAATRNFDLVFADARPSFLWVGGRGTAYQVSLFVCTSYAGVEPETRDHIKAADAVDLRRELRRLIPTIDGLCNVETLGERNEVDIEATHYVAHAFLIHYHQATTS